MSTQYKHQDTLIAGLVNLWLGGQREEVRRIIRGLKNVQIGYVAAGVCYHLAPREESYQFYRFMNPNLKD